MAFHVLKNPIQTYAWGSPTVIPELLGFANPGGGPVAELWMGAHPSASSSVAVGSKQVPLEAVIASDPDRYLGADVVSRFGPRLPFLFKVLSVQTALSIQVHPNRTQARAGFEREQAGGIAIDCAQRSYRDANHKPEVLCALTRFQGLSEFRGRDEVLAELAEPEFAIDAAKPLRDALQGFGDDAVANVRFLEAVLTSTARQVGSLVSAAISLAARRGSAESRKRTGGANTGLPNRYGWIDRLAMQFPGDVGVLAPLFLDLFTLEPGQAVYLGAGTLHAYLNGTGIELMASSDNVLRGGLTSKHVNVGELLNLVDGAASGPAILDRGDRAALHARSGDTVGFLQRYRTAASEFELSHIVLDGDDAVDFERSRSPQIALCLGGRARFATSEKLQITTRGDSLFIPAFVDRYSVSGPGELYVASVPEPKTAGRQRDNGAILHDHLG